MNKMVPEKKLLGTVSPTSPELFHLQAVGKHNWMHFWIYLESTYVHEERVHEKTLDANKQNT